VRAEANTNATREESWRIVLLLLPPFAPHSPATLLSPARIVPSTEMTMEQQKLDWMRIIRAQKGKGGSHPVKQNARES